MTVVAAIQHDVVVEDAAATREALAPRLARAAAEGARLLVLTEMFATGFSMAPERVAEAPDGPSSDFLRATASRLDVWIGGSLPIRDHPRDPPVNRFVLAGPDGTVHHSDKVHPFTHGGEHEHYRPGSGAPVTVDVDGLRVTPVVCYDLRFAPQLWAVAETTDAYLVVANWPERRRSHWSALLVARAIENQAWVVGVNRVGEGGGIRYAGDSVIVDPLGEEVAVARRQPATLVADVDPARVAEVRARYPFLADRRR